MALSMIEQPCRGVPFGWVAADSVYGVGDIESRCAVPAKGYVLGVNAAVSFHGSSQGADGQAAGQLPRHPAPDDRRSGEEVYRGRRSR